MNNVELKPCPFCGGEAKVAWGTYDTKPYWAYCKENGHGMGKRFDTEAEAIEAWNRRANDEG